MARKSIRPPSRRAQRAEGCTHRVAREASELALSGARPPSLEPRPLADQVERSGDALQPLVDAEHGQQRAIRGRERASDRELAVDSEVVDVAECGVDALVGRGDRGRVAAGCERTEARSRVCVEQAADQTYV